MAHSGPLLLEAAAHGEGQGWRKGQGLIDAQPYIDDLPPETKRKVELMVEEEKRRSVKGPAEYIKDLPPLPLFNFQGHTVLSNEYQRVVQRQPMEALDTARYRLDPPPQNRRNDLNAWKHALENAHSQLEHQNLRDGACECPDSEISADCNRRILNLELLLKYGPNVWRAQNQIVDTLHKNTEKQLLDTKKKMDHLNKERKVHQTSLGVELGKLEEEWRQLVQKNIEITEACTKLELEIDAMTQQIEGNNAETVNGDEEKHEITESHAQEAKGDLLDGDVKVPNGVSPDGPASIEDG